MTSKPINPLKIKKLSACYSLTMTSADVIITGGAAGQVI
jgi:hypothetical protein